MFESQKRTILECTPAFLALAGASQESIPALRVNDSMLLPGNGGT